MGGMSVHYKVPVRERLPQDLIAMMKETSDLIDEGDESASIVSDDLLQWEMCYGGLCDAEKQMFGFSYFPAVPSDENEVVLPQWFLYFSREQIRAIANGSVRKLICGAVMATAAIVSGHPKLLQPLRLRFNAAPVGLASCCLSGWTKIIPSNTQLGQRTKAAQ
jgi:hypothetical protein